MEYVPYGSADGNEAVGSALSDLASGQVDLMGPLLKNAATEEIFEFTENSYGTVYTTLVALAAGSLRENNLRDRDVPGQVEKMKLAAKLTPEQAAAVDIPVVAIGGISHDNILELKNCGLDGVAVVSALFAQADVKAAAEELLRLSEEIAR